MARTPPAVFPSIEAAEAEGFTDFTPDDICPVSGFVLRLAGLRLESRELVMRMLGLGGRTPDPRLSLYRIAEDDPEARTLIAEADLVIGALGYRPRALPLFDRDGQPMALAHEAGRPMVDRHCRILDDRDRPVPAPMASVCPRVSFPGARWGREEFPGQANGLWLWQNDVGQMIVDQLLGRDVAGHASVAA